MANYQNDHTTKSIDIWKIKLMSPVISGKSQTHQGVYWHSCMQMTPRILKEKLCFSIETLSGDLLPSWRDPGDIPTQVINWENKKSKINFKQEQLPCYYAKPGHWNCWSCRLWGPKNQKTMCEHAKDTFQVPHQLQWLGGCWNRTNFYPSKPNGLCYVFSNSSSSSDSNNQVSPCP